MGVGSPVPPAVILAVVLAAYGGRRRTSGNRLLEPGEPRKPRETRGSGELRDFLKMNREEGFDLEALNVIDVRAVEKEAIGDFRLSREAVRQVEALMPRVRAETEDPGLAGAILRKKTLDWYRRSPYPGWAEKMPPRWGGIFSDSMVPGGRLSHKLTTRLASLYTECAKAGGWWGGLLRNRAIAKLLGGGPRRPHQPMMQQVAQAYLDDLATNHRNGDRPFGLERLSELARRIGSADMNRTLAELFRHEGGGPVIVLDPRFHPDIGGLIVRAPPPKAIGDAITYDLVHAKAGETRQSVVPDGAATEASLNSPWEREDIAKKDWLGLLAQLRKRKERLEPPPIENYRNQESYRGLRELLLEDPSARSAFLAVHWKGKPSGLAMLAGLLSEGAFVPEADTDADYLEAELNHIEKGDPDRRSPDGRWKLGHGWTVVRKIADGNVRTYGAGRTPRD